jgi:hypothetical protein
MRKLTERIKKLERCINSIYWGVQDESDTQAIAVYIEQEFPELLDLEDDHGQQKRDAETTERTDE